MGEKKINRREKKKSEARERIVSAALKVLLEKGFNDTTVAEIMEAADLGTGTFYNYFQSKEEVVTYSMSVKVAEAWGAIEKVKEKTVPAAQKLAEIITSAGQVFAETKPLMGLYMQAKRSNPELHGLPSHNKLFKEALTGVFKEGQATGEFNSNIPAEVITEMVFGILQSTVVSQSTSLSFEANLQTKVKVLLEGILSNTGH